jgi:hypothetical protein
MPLPPVSNAVATKLTGIVAAVEVDVAFVPGYVIDAVRDQFALAGALKIMV